SLSENDVKHINAITIFPSGHRTWTGHALSPEGPLGFEIGVETAFVFRHDLLYLGDQRGVAPSVIPVPRIWTSVEIPMNIKLSGHVGLGALFDGIQTAGFGAQWSFYKDPAQDTAFSVDFRYTRVNLFNDAYSNLMGFAAQASKDLIVWQPYAGAGFMVANTTVKSEVLDAGAKTGPYTSATYHLFVGARIDLIAKLSIQLDVMAARPSVGVLLEKSF
ncbi:MAG: hypothetical protein ABIR96_01275, partial [Bdellovibrionota bacterium]